MVGQGREKFSNGNIVEGSFFKNKHNGPCRKKYENGDSPIMNSPNVNSPLGCSPNRGGPNDDVSEKERLTARCR